MFLILNFCFSVLSQSIAIAYKRQNPASVVVVQAYDPRPSIKIKAADDADLPFRRFGFVEAIQELDPAGALGLLPPDYKVSLHGFVI